MNKVAIHTFCCAVLVGVLQMGCEKDSTPSGPNQITSPSDGETWLIGETRIIEWKADQVDRSKGTLWLQSAFGGGGADDGVISSSVDMAAGSFAWRVGILENGRTAPPSDYRISWRTQETPTMWSYTGHSDVFTIKAAP